MTFSIGVYCVLCSSFCVIKSCCIPSSTTFPFVLFAFNNIIMNIGQKSLAIYLLQYFFLPDIKNYDWVNNLDVCTIHIVSAIYTIAITITCIVFIAIFSNSTYVKKYCLGQK